MDSELNYIPCNLKSCITSVSEEMDKKVEDTGDVHKLSTLLRGALGRRDGVAGPATHNIYSRLVFTTEENGSRGEEVGRWGGEGWRESVFTVCLSVCLFDCKCIFRADAETHDIQGGHYLTITA